MLARIFSAALWGVEALRVEVEVDNSPGAFLTRVVGLPDAAVRESLHRVSTALQNAGFRSPAGRTTINLAPADLRKEGPSFDLPIALAVLGATDQLVSPQIGDFWALGELALSGELRPVRGVLPAVMEAKRRRAKHVLLPAANAPEAAVVEGIRVHAATSLAEAAAVLRDPEASPQWGGWTPPSPPEPSPELDFADVKGQLAAKRALEIAVAGGHNVLLIGPPGSGKSMLAQRIPSIFPPMTLDESIEATRIHSVAGLLPNGEGLLRYRPFRAPHHSTSDAGLVGGGPRLLPGEVSLAHHGVLFLDELPEFSRNALEALRQPLEDGKLTISRAVGTVTFPAGFMLVAAMNPSPTGGFDDAARGKCSPAAMRRYLHRISGPLLDRIDLHVEVPAVDQKILLREEFAESSASIRDRVERARAIQAQRLSGRRKIHNNARMGPREIARFCVLSPTCASFLSAALSDLGLSARAFHRVLKVARTIADLAGREELREEDLAEAIGFRSLDRRIWGE
ncbi:Competence protein ComM [Methylacidimicrobium cyclopophantes]|uniref:Competence protein ComM n=1 Tax=Methylacidimicrobium cyclopophantes TaxID=1041766 RepID=A0A5E6MKT7_9BACT|nr:YifB family Mg chelatase-like AAA ATPase [Methylacidimicrobium cyclopophantes]VVM06667.1 Competence protein ComM [Methylacidimicrobium cyclopophantes]